MNADSVLKRTHTTTEQQLSAAAGGREEMAVVATTAAASAAAAAAATVKIDSKFAHKTLQDYEVLSVIGNGCFGTCYKVCDKTSGQLCVWKGVDYDDDVLDGAAREALTREIDVLRQLQHPNIVQYYHHLIHADAKTIFIVMECCEGGDLAQLIAKARVEQRRFEERYVWRVLFQLCRALQLCHTRLSEGTLLHRDIKPANIFLDAAGNAKLGDFGLARMLRGSEDECFARTIVGTPYYMSPELMRGVRYDRTSDVWALGCLVYELCSLRPPFRGRDCMQLSVSIASGKCSRIPAVYSADLQAIINCMLAVECEQRPGIEVISRHPIVVRNIADVGSDYPQLVPIASDELGERSRMDGGGVPGKLEFSPQCNSSSVDTTVLERASRQHRLSASGGFTPDLRNELFYSAKRRICFSRLQRSDPQLYESIQQEEHNNNNNNNNSNNNNNKSVNPEQLTHSIFNAALQSRLTSIRVQESLLQQRELNLNERERQLIEWEKRLQAKERELLEQTKAIQQVHAVANATASVHTRSEEQPMPPPPPPPPIPPRKPSRPHDDTYCSIEPNDVLLQTPTVAKLNLAALPAPKAFPAVRKMVTFQSPKKFISYDIENLPPSAAPLPPPTAARKGIIGSQSSRSSSSGSVHQLRASTSSKSSNESNTTAKQQHQHRRKSLLSSIFGLHRSKDSLTAAANTKKVAEANVTPTPISTTVPTPVPVPMPVNGSTQIIAKCQTTELSSMWTKEHKRAAFDLLAAMNAAERYSGNNAAPARHKLRQSVRERNLQRSRLRRSMVAMPTTTTMQPVVATSNHHRGGAVSIA